MEHQQNTKEVKTSHQVGNLCYTNQNFEEVNIKGNIQHNDCSHTVQQDRNCDAASPLSNRDAAKRACTAARGANSSTSTRAQQRTQHRTWATQQQRSNPTPDPNQQQTITKTPIPPQMLRTREREGQSCHHVK